jgi:hypothetical protein
MGHATIKKYRRKTMKNKSKGKKLHLKKNLKLRTKQKNGKKTQKRFRLKNKTKRMKKTKKTKKMKGGEDGDEVPERKDYKKEDGTFNAKAFMEAIQAYNKQQAEAMQVKDPTEPRENINIIGEECTNVDPSKNYVNELGGMKPNYLKFQFEGKKHIYCYNYEDIEQNLNTIGNICCVWKKKEEAEFNEEGWGTSCVVRNTYDLLDNVCDYINGGELNNPEEHTAGDDYLCVWRSLINARTWISQDAVRTINTFKNKKGTFVLHNPKQTLIGNLYNVFGVGMLHGQQPGEMIFDISFNPVPENPTFTSDEMLDKATLLTEYEKIYNQFWNSPPLLDNSFDSFASYSTQSYEEQPEAIVNIGNMITPPRNNTGTPIEQMSPISPNRQLFANSPGGTPNRSIREEIWDVSANRSYLIHNDLPLTMDDLSPWTGIDQVFRDLDTTSSHSHRPLSIVSIPTNESNPTTDGFVYLSPGSSLIPHSEGMGIVRGDTPMHIDELATGQQIRRRRGPISPIPFGDLDGLVSDDDNTILPSSPSVSRSLINPPPDNPNLPPPVPLPIDNFPPRSPSTSPPGNDN